MVKNSQSGPSACKFLYDDDCTSIFQIPSRLVKSYGDDIPKVATLRVRSSDKCWKVSIEKFKGQYFFTDGWKQFAEQVDMKTREYLLFKDAGFSDFRVSDEKDNHGTEEGTRRMGDYAKAKTPRMNVTGGSTDAGVDGSLSFTLELQTYHCSRVDMPRDFVRNAGLDKICEIKLQDGEGEEWPVSVVERGGKKSGLQFALATGWSRFRMSNSLVAGDIISFVLISDDTIRVQVITPGMDEPSNFAKTNQENSENMDLDVKSGSEDLCTKSQNGSVVGDDRLENSGDEHSDPDGVEASLAGKRWRFITKLRKHHVYRLGIPAVFARDTGIATDRRIKLKDADGREWPVSVSDKGCGQFHFGGGWHDFLVGNDVVVGSSLVFEFIPSSDNTVEVRVVKTGRDENMLFKFVKLNCENMDFGVGRRSQNGRRSSVTQNGRRSSFTKEVQKHNFYTLDIPKDFVTENRMEKKNKIKLRDAEGRKWKIHLAERNEQFRLSTGWNDFVKGNNIVIGSTLAFFLSSSDTLDVQIAKEGPDKQALFKYLRKVNRKLELMEPHEISDLEKGHENVSNASDDAGVPANSVLNVKSANEDHSSSEEEMDVELAE